MPKRILLVDDEKMVRDFFALLLKKSGIVIDMAVHGEDALDKLANVTYDLVISDINMPKLNGIDLYHQVVEAHPYLRDKFILITGDNPGDLNTLSALKDKIIEKSRIDEIIRRVELFTVRP